MSTKRIISVILIFEIVMWGIGHSVAARFLQRDVVTTNSLAAAVSANAGGPLGSRFVIFNNASVAEQNAAVAYNPNRNEYLVVWYNDRSSNDDIQAQRVAGDGTLVGPSFIISAGSGAERRYPDVAYNSQRDEYLVVWEYYESSTGYAVRGRVVSAAGEVQGPGDIIFAANPSIFTNYLQPAVAYASASDKYLLVFRYDNGSMSWQTLAAEEIPSDGGSYTSFLNIVDWNTPDLPEGPDVSYNRSRDECLVVWQQTTGGSGDLDVYGRRIAMGGTDPIAVTGSVLSIANTSSGEESTPAVAAVPTTPDAGKYLVAWQVDGDIRMQMVDGDGTQHTTQTLADTAWTEHSPAVAGSEGRQQFLVAWVWIPVITPPAMMQVYGRSVAVDGAVLGTGSVEVGGGQVFKTAIAAGGTGDYLVAFDDNETLGISNRGIYGRLWGTRVYLPLVIAQ